MKDKRREDAWAENHDLTLAQTVISHIQNGSTQLAAFEESASRLNRTAAACGFRWNKELRSQYEAEINDAKLHRMKQRKPKREGFAAISTVSRVDDENTPPKYDEAFRQIIKIAKDQAQKFEQLIQENSRLRVEINELKNQKNSNLDGIKTNEDIATEDLQTFLKIMNRARNLSSLNLNL
ncbi:RsfA family transcriptional regulator [Paenibacillus aceris]|uniref:Prespore-specific regulator n=1 Tax=Paenibacillus aceris TaxID=869555 RepID=A0ABS4HXG4_9BACL|nr:RsfA family transcriptional regulator [Paenibacillus aceris]MBP1963347.1 prespore-specific regulator [Paenibacillus aceris]NHW36146.1 RsfA family transcriptional regulator [Paenibacillus aceris]